MEFEHAEVPLLTDGSNRAPVTLMLAHGAGAGMDTDFLNAFATGLAGRDTRVVRFEFPYMARRRETGKRRPPDREPVLRKAWLRVIESADARHLIIGGKSMGGRIASLIADEAQVAGLVCLGYPFHPSEKPDRLRVEHLRTIQTPTLIVQGQRDALGSKGEVAKYKLSGAIQLHWLPDGDHSFRPREASGRTVEDNWQDAMTAVAEFLRMLSADGP